MERAGEFTIRHARWSHEADAIRSVRQRVFIDEQGVLPDEEWDDLDPSCHHLLAVDERGEAVGCTRLCPGGRLGRMAVLPRWRGQGVGRALLEHVVELARRLGLSRLEADAQVRALGFYRRLGFQVCGPEFLDARIPHRRVWRELD